MVVVVEVVVVDVVVEVVVVDVVDVSEVGGWSDAAPAVEIPVPVAITVATPSAKAASARRTVDRARRGEVASSREWDVLMDSVCSVKWHPRRQMQKISA